ncbi:GNAT family N-acetyltransferase [Streptomyces buecherae]|uniref:GNAT family N-acetyltransferase n=1 Tax=Streptomyces buecherae TaxID=2763006 RepID=UPI00365C7F43
MSLSPAPVIPTGRLSHSAQPTLVSPDGALLLRPWAVADADVVHGAYQDAGIQKWSLRRMASRDEVLRWIAAGERQWRQERAAQWAVADARSGEVLGRTALRWMDLAHGLAESAYWVLPHARGRGVAPRALTTLTRWALDEAGFHRLELAHSDRNEPSCTVALRAGYAFEGTRRSALRHADGWHDMHLHARVRGDA